MDDATDDAGVEPFVAHVPDEVLDDLAERLARTRWPDPEPVDDHSQGAPLAFVRQLFDRWVDGYDWRRCEARLNAFDQVRTTIDGVGIHAIHQRSPEPDARPLVLTHGWPGSVLELLDCIGPLADPVAHGGEAADAFHVVCPSLPGYGFSDRPTEVGWGIERIAAATDELMARLGYDRYLAQGGDWGSMVTAALGTHHVDRVAGIHLNMPVVLPDVGDDITPAEQQILDDGAAFRRDGSAYLRLQSTRPQTLGYALADSPVGQLAWIAEKLWAWTSHDGDVTEVLSVDQMLDDVTLYWVTNTAASSARLYWEALRPPVLPVPTVPVGCTIFPGEMNRTSRRWAEAQYPDLVYFSEVDRGGHFAAWEQPELFVDEVRASFRAMR